MIVTGVCDSDRVAIVMGGVIVIGGCDSDSTHNENGDLST